MPGTTRSRGLAVGLGLLFALGLGMAWQAGAEAHRAPAALTPFRLYLEMERGELDEHVRVLSDTLASACDYVVLTSDFHPQPGDDNGLVTQEVLVPASGTYYLWVRARASDYVHNSFFFYVDRPIADYMSMYNEVNPPDGHWVWFKVKYSTEEAARPLHLDAGTRTLAFMGREPDTRLDALFLTDDPAATPPAIAYCGATPTPTITPTPTATRVAFSRYLEVEQGSIDSYMSVVRDETSASACGYVYPATPVPNPYQPGPQNGLVTLPITVPMSGNYYLFVRVMGFSEWSSSFFFYVDQQSTTDAMYKKISPWDARWVWYKVQHNTEDSQTRPLYLSAGAHRLGFMGRERLTRLDAIYLTNDPAGTPPGIVACGPLRLLLPLALKASPAATSGASATPTSVTPTFTPGPTPSTTPTYGCSDIYEPNDHMEYAVPIPLGRTIRAKLSARRGEEDNYRFTITSAHLRIVIHLPPTFSGQQNCVYLYKVGAFGAPILGYPAYGLDPAMWVDMNKTWDLGAWGLGEYVLRLYTGDINGFGDDENCYTLRVSSE
jgi:hypothetical protein